MNEATLTVSLCLICFALAFLYLASTMQTIIIFP